MIPTSEQITEDVPLLREMLEVYEDDPLIVMRLTLILRIKEGSFTTFKELATELGTYPSKLSIWYKHYILNGLDSLITLSEKGNTWLSKVDRIEDKKKGRCCALCGCYFDFEVGREAICESCLTWATYRKMDTSKYVVVK